jgi:hypothetical protein
MLRSENVACVSLYIGSDNIESVIEKIGDQEILHFIDKEVKDRKHIRN